MTTGEGSQYLYALEVLVTTYNVETSKKDILKIKKTMYIV